MTAITRRRPAATGTARYRRQARRGAAREVLFYLAVVIVVVVALFPFYWILRTSLESDSQVAAGVGGLVLFGVPAVKDARGSAAADPDGQNWRTRPLGRVQPRGMKKSFAVRVLG